MALFVYPGIDKLEIRVTTGERTRLMLKGEDPKKPFPRFWNILQQLLSAFRLLGQQLGWFALAGLAVTFGLFLLFARLTDEVFSNEFEFASFDKNVLSGLHDLSNPVPNSLFIGLTALGNTVAVRL